MRRGSSWSKRRAGSDKWGRTLVTREALYASLLVAVKQHVRYGWGIVALAVAVNLPWVVALRYVSSHLQLSQLRPM
jgi:hypothetical protein